MWTTWSSGWACSRSSTGSPSEQGCSAQGGGWGRWGGAGGRREKRRRGGQRLVGAPPTASCSRPLALATLHRRRRREEIANAVEYMRILEKYAGAEAGRPRARQLLAVALASGLPFVGFGFVDNRCGDGVRVSAAGVACCRPGCRGASPLPRMHAA